MQAALTLVLERVPVHRARTAVGLAGSVTTVAAVAAPAPDATRPAHHGQRGEMWKMADANGDGRISQAEFVQQAQVRFARLDTNHDGFVDGAEHQAQRDKRHQRRAEWRARRGAMAQPVGPAPANAQ